MENPKIESLQAQIADLKRQWPAHSVPPSMLRELEDLEEALALELAKSDEGEETGA